MDEMTTKKIKNSDCPCDSPGYCAEYGVHMSEHLHNKCVNQPTWRLQFESLIGYTEQNEPLEERQRKQEEYQEMQSHEQQLDEVISYIETEKGITIDNYNDKTQGLGDVVGNVLSKFGVTEEVVEKWGGIGGCGCSKRKKFLNTILPFRKKE